MAIVYAAFYVALYKIATEIPQVLRAERPSDAMLVSVRGTLTIPWWVWILSLPLGIATYVALHGSP